MNEASNPPAGGKKDITINDLAIMIRQGFVENDRRFTKLEQGQTKLEQGQEEIKMRLTNVVYSFDMIELQKRVMKLEDKVLRRSRILSYR